MLLTCYCFRKTLAHHAISCVVSGLTHYMSVTAGATRNDDIIAHTSCFVALGRIVALIMASTRARIDTAQLSKAVCTYLTLYKALYGCENVLFKSTLRCANVRLHSFKRISYAHKRKDVTSQCAHTHTTTYHRLSALIRRLRSPSASPFCKPS